MRLAAALCIMATGAVAQDCPTPADLDTGILLEMDNGDFSIRSQLVEDGIKVTSIVPQADGSILESSAIYQHPLALPRVVHTDGPTIASYNEPLVGLDALLTTREWSADFEFHEGDRLVAEGTQTVRLTGLGQMTLGSCSYDTWRVFREIGYSDGFSLTSELIFSPDLGIILGETMLDEAGQPRAAVLFDQIKAE